MKKRISAIMNIIISVFLLIAVQTFLHPCKGDMAMPCNYSTTAAILVLVLIAVLNIGKLFVSESSGRVVLGITTIVAGVELLVIPHLGRCQMATMSCNTKTFPSLTIGAVLIIVLTVIFEIVYLIGNQGKHHAGDQ